MSIEACGVEPLEFESKVSELSEHAFDDQDTIANPKMPLVTELAEIYRSAYKGV